MPTKSPVIIDLKFDQEQVAAALKHAFPDREVSNLLLPASRNRDLSAIDYAVVWKPGADLFSRAKDLKVVFSGGAGVDHVLTLPGLPDVPLVRPRMPGEAARAGCQTQPPDFRHARPWQVAPVPEQRNRVQIDGELGGHRHGSKIGVRCPYSAIFAERTRLLIVPVASATDRRGR